MAAAAMAPTPQEFLKMALLRGFGSPLSSLECALIASTDALDQKKAFKTWIKEQLPKDGEYGTIDETDDKILGLFKTALNHGISKQLDLQILCLEGQLRVLRILSGSDALKANIEKGLMSLRLPDTDGFAVVDTPQQIGRRVICLLKKWKANPELVLTAEKGEVVFEKIAKDIETLSKRFVAVAEKESTAS